MFIYFSPLALVSVLFFSFYLAISIPTFFFLPLLFFFVRLYMETGSELRRADLLQRVQGPRPCARAVRGFIVRRETARQSPLAQVGGVALNVTGTLRSEVLGWGVGGRGTKTNRARHCYTDNGHTLIFTFGRA